MNDRRILIVRQDRIGDSVLSTPIPREIKKKWPESFIAVLVRNYTRDIFVNNPNIDEIILYEDLKWNGLKEFLRSVKKIRQYKFTHALMLLPSERINYLLFFAGIKNRIGVGQKFYQFITFVKNVNRHKYIPLRHEADYCMDQARKIGIETNNIDTKIYLSEDEIKKVQEIRGEWSAGNKSIVGINITSGNSAPNLTVNDYLKLIERLREKENYKIIITDNKIPTGIRNLKGIAFPNISSGLRNSIINIASLDCLISSSTGPMHIAAALGIKTISIFCPLPACSPDLWGPLGNAHITILPQENYCSVKCPGEPKVCTFNGQADILIDKIIQSLPSLIK